MDRNGAKLSAGSAALAMIPTWVRCTPHRPSLCCINGEYGCNTLVLQWGHRLSAMETSMPDPQPVSPRRPSMGPPPFGDGNAVLAGPPPLRRPAFNGATAFRRWKRNHQELSARDRLYLQWGHHLSAMETYDSDWWTPEGEAPSMGPPPFGDGNEIRGH